MCRDFALEPLFETPRRHHEGSTVGLLGHLFRRNKNVRVDVQRGRYPALSDAVSDLTGRDSLPMPERNAGNLESRFARLKIPAESVATHQTRETRRLPGVLQDGRARATLKERRSVSRSERRWLRARTPSKPSPPLPEAHLTASTRTIAVASPFTNARDPRRLPQFVSALQLSATTARRRLSASHTLSCCTTTANRGHIRSAAAKPCP